MTKKILKFIWSWWGRGILLLWISSSLLASMEMKSLQIVNVFSNLTNNFLDKKIVLSYIGAGFLYSTFVELAKGCFIFIFSVYQESSWIKRIFLILGIIFVIYGGVRKIRMI